MLRQALKFGVVGLLATAVHVMVGVLLIGLGWSAAFANPAAFATAFLVSFVGHFYVSFADQNSPKWQALRRFALVACLGFLCNQAILASVLATGFVPAAFALALSTLFAAAVTFVLSRRWAFRDGSGRMRDP